MKIPALILSLFLSLNIFAQSQTEAELYTTFLKAEKKAVVAENMKLTDKDAAIFWSIYDEYMLERSELSQDKGALAMYYLENIESHDPKAIDKIVKTTAHNQMTDIKLMEKYYKKIKKALSEEIGLRFYFIEEQLQLLLKQGLYQELPLINTYGENVK